MVFFLRTLAALLVVAGSLVARAEATAIAFTSRSAWETAVGSVNTIDFEDIAPVNGSINVPSLVIDGINFGAVTVADSGLGIFISGWGTGDMLFNFALGTPRDIAFTTPLTAFGFSYGATCVFFIPCSPAHTAVVLSTGETFVASGPIPPMAFFGVVSDVPLTGFTVAFVPSLPVLDNFSYAAPIPEPATSLLVSTGLVAALWRRRGTLRRHQSK